MKTIAHHACLKDGGKKHVLENGPFKSDKYYSQKYDEEFPPFLGAGYYYWDNNLDMAHRWGSIRYSKKNYFIIESELSMTGSHFLDLVGNRSQIINFIDLKEKLHKIKPETRDWAMGDLIEFLKTLNEIEEYKTIFDYTILRAVDVSKQKKDERKLRFSRDIGKKNYTYLDPCIVICLTQKDPKVILKSVIHKSSL